MKPYNWLVQNKKIKKTSRKTGTKILNWGIPACQSQCGLVTCPNAGACKIGCYAKEGGYIFSNVSAIFEKRLELTQAKAFVPTIVDEIKRRKPDAIRIHDSGDFYNAEYTFRWLLIIQRCPEVNFYAYTKEVKRFKALKIKGLIPSNLNIIYSYGGKQDKWIDPKTDAHAFVFENLKELKRARYTNGTEDDSVAANGRARKIGLVYHGAKSYINTFWFKVKQIA